jgi:hypothetical protein
VPTHSLQIEIGAVLKNGFGATISSGMNQLSKLGSTIKQLEASSKNIGKFTGLQQATLSAKKDWADAEAEVKALATQMRSIAAPSAEMSNAFGTKYQHLSRQLGRPGTGLPAELSLDP